MFVAKTFVKTLAPHSKLYGGERKEVTGIIQVVAVMTVMSQ